MYIKTLCFFIYTNSEKIFSGISVDVKPSLKNAVSL